MYDQGQGSGLCDQGEGSGQGSECDQAQANPVVRVRPLALSGLVALPPSAWTTGGTFPAGFSGVS